MPRHSPLEPIFHRKLKYGAVQFAGTPVVPPSEICMSILGNEIDATNLEQARGLWVESGHAYVAANLGATSDGRLTVVDVSDNTDPTVVGSVLSSHLDGAHGVAKSGDWVFVATASEQGIAAVNVSSPSSPGTPEFVSDPEFLAPWGIVVSGIYAYVADAVADELITVDVSDPTAMFVEAGFAHADLDGAVGVAISGNTILLTSQNTSRLFSLDTATNPDDPDLISILNDAALADAEGVAVVGDLAVVACLNGTVTCVNVSNPSSMSVLGSISHADYNGASYVAMTSTRAYVTCNTTNRVVAFDISDPTNPTELGTPFGRITDGTNLDEPDGIFRVGSKLYVVSNDSNNLVVIGC